MKKNSNIIKIIKILSISIEKEINKILVSENLTFSQSMILRYLLKNHDKDVNPIDIEKYYSLSHATVSGILKRLEKKEFITLKKDSKDSRFKVVRLTESGKQLEEKIRNNLKNLDKRMCEGLSDDQINMTIDNLNIVLSNLRKEN